MLEHSPARETDAMSALNGLPDSVFINFYFAPHAEASDFAQLDELLPACDIYVPEWPGWTTGMLETYQAAAKGNYSAYQWMRDWIEQTGVPDARLFELSKLYGSQKEVEFIDLPYGSQLFEDLTTVHQRMRAVEQEGKEDVFELFVAQANIQREREEQIIHNLAHVLPHAISSNRRLANKESVRVLVNLGAVHTNIHHLASRALNIAEKKRVSRNFNSKPVLYPIGAVATRRQIIHQDLSEATLATDIGRMDHANL